MSTSTSRPRARVRDIQVYYEEEGVGFPLLMIMGLGGNLDWWDPRLLQALSARFTTIVFDNRGTGRTDRSEREYSMALLAEDAVGLLDALRIPKAHVLGISMGGMIAQELALSHPEKVERLVLCSTNCGGRKSIPAPQETLGLMARAASASSEEEVARMTVPLIFTEAFRNANPAAVETWIRRVLKAPTPLDTYLRQLHAITGFDAYDRLPGLRAPTLVLRGRKDILIPPENGAVLAQAIPHARLVDLEHSGHGLAEDMDEVLRSVMEFLGQPF